NCIVDIDAGGTDSADHDFGSGAVREPFGVGFEAFPGLLSLSAAGVVARNHQHPCVHAAAVEIDQGDKLIALLGTAAVEAREDEVGGVEYAGRALLQLREAGTAGFFKAVL